MDPIIPILGTEDPNGQRYTMHQTVGIAVGAASVLFKSEDGKRLDGVFDDATARRIVDELMANIDQFASERVAEHIKTQEAKRALILRREDWHDFPDAMVWAEKFIELRAQAIQEGRSDDVRPDDAGFMVSWFANAMAAAQRPLEKQIRDIEDQNTFYAGRKIIE
jgi:hypothetical protein